MLWPACQTFDAAWMWCAMLASDELSFETMLLKYVKVLNSVGASEG